ncbi:MAG: lipopolysaccharide biosynthesis protein [Planctomycetaceae bacterium]|jgi:O-antigen/teichoic acid export membrane protein
MPTGSKRNFATGALIGTAGQGLNLILGFYLTRLIVGSLDLEWVGLWQMLQDLAGYYTLSDLGIGRATTKYLSQHAAANDRPAFFRVLGTSLSTSRKLSLMAFTISLLLAIGLPYVINLGTLPLNLVRGLIFLTGLRVCFTLAAGAYHSVPPALGAFQFANTIHYLTAFLGSIAIIVALWLGGGVMAMSLIALAIQVLSRTCYIIVSHRLIEFPAEGLPPPDNQIRKDLFQFGLIAFLIQASQRVVSFSSSLLIASFSNLGDSALYGISQSLSNRCRDFSKSISDLLMPTASRMKTQNDARQLQRLAVLSCRVLGTICLVFLVNIATLGVPFFSEWLDQPKLAIDAQPIAVLLLGAMLFKLSVGGLVATLEGIGAMPLLGKICAIEAVLTLGMQALALRWSGLQGMATALLVCQFLVNGVLMVVMAAPVLQIQPVKLFWRLWSPLVVTAIPGLLVGWACATWLPPTAIWAVLAEFSLVGVTLLATAFYTCLDHEARREMRDMVQKRLAKRFGKQTAKPPQS